MDDKVLSDMLEAAWGLIANAGGGDWSRETDEWNVAAVKWRDGYHALLNAGPRHVRMVPETHLKGKQGEPKTT